MKRQNTKFSKALIVTMIIAMLFSMTACNPGKKQAADMPTDPTKTSDLTIGDGEINEHTSPEETYAPTETELFTEEPDDATEAPTTTIQDVVYATQEVNVRAGPDTCYEKVGVLKKNESAERISEDEYGWSKIIFKGEICYVANFYITTTQPNTPTQNTEKTPETTDTQTYEEVDEMVSAKDDVNVRSGPGTKYSKVGVLEEGESVKRIAVGSEGWDKIIYNNETYYIAHSYLKPVSNENENLSTSETPLPEESKNTDTTSNTSPEIPTEKPTEAPTEAPTEPSETEPPHQHNYQTKKIISPTCTENGYVINECSCGEKYNGDEIAAVGHNWSNWYVTKEATTTEEGLKTRKCTFCPTIQTETILPKQQ